MPHLDDNSGLTPEEQRFFETGVLNTPADTSGAPVDPLALGGLGTDTPAPETPPAATPTPPVIEPPVIPPQPGLPDMAEILRRNLSDAQQRVAELEAAARQAAKPPEPETGPDPATDPLGALVHQLSNIQKQITTLQSAQQQNATQQQQITQFQQFQQSVQSLRAQFATTTPDFDAAYAHVRNVRIADLQSFGLTQQKINEILFREEVTLSENAINNGKNPAAVIYEMAKRHGYTPTTTTSTQSQQTPAQKLAAQAAAQSAARTLPSQPTTADTEITHEGLKNMSEADLNKLVLNEKLWDKMTGKTEYPL